MIVLPSRRTTKSPYLRAFIVFGRRFRRHQRIKAETGTVVGACIQENRQGGEAIDIIIQGVNLIRRQFENPDRRS